MFINIDYGKKIPNGKFELAKPNKVVISNISEKFRANISTKIGNINELSFSIPHFIDGEKNHHIEMIKEKMYIKVTMGAEKEWFIVDSIEEDGDDTDIFNVTAFSLPYELTGKRISGFTSESINPRELMDSILSETLWKVKEIDPIFEDVFRSFESGDDSNVLECILQSAETFGYLIIWDSNTREISFKDMEKNGKFRGLSINYGRLLRSVKRTRTSDEMVTRLWIEGNEGLTIHSVNPTGQGFIEDFSYFMYPFERDVNKNVLKSSDFMSDDLCNAILDHKILLQENSPEIKILTDQLFLKQSELVTEQSELDILNSELENILELLDVAKATEDNALISQRQSEADSKQAEVDSQQIVVDNLNASIENIKTQIQNKQDNISSQANFTQELLDELNPYIIEKKWSDDRYIDVEELYNDGLKEFEKLRNPKVVVEVTMDNLLNVVEEQYYWDKVVLGDIVKVKYPQMNIEYMAKIIEINYDLENGEASLVIANTKDLLDDFEKFKQLIYSNQSASNLVQNNKYKWNKVNVIAEEISNLLTSEWDANKNKITAGVNNSIEIGNRGMIVKSIDIPNEMVIIQAGIIALTKDGGETWKTAIKPDGIVAERLIGQIIAGQELIITNSAGTFTLDNNGARFDVNSFIITSEDNDNLVDRWQDASQWSEDFQADNIITPYEKKIIKTEWDKFVTKYNANIEKVESFYEDDGASLAFVNDYKYKYEDLYDYLFVTLHGEKPLLDPTNMAYTTRIEKSVYDLKFKQYDNAEVELEKELDLKAKQIADSAQKSADDAQRNIDEVMDDVVYKIELFSPKGTQFKNGNLDTTITATVYRGKEDITSTIPNSGFIWTKRDKDGVIDTAWGNANANVGKTINVSYIDVYQSATFRCQINIEE